MSGGDRSWVVRGAALWVAGSLVGPLAGCGDDTSTGGRGGGGGTGAGAVGGAPAADIVVDLGGTTAPSTLTQGLLHGVAAGPVPAATLERVDALAPRFWRVSNLYDAAAYKLVVAGDLRAKFGTRVQLNLNDFFSATYGFPVVIDPGCDPASGPQCIPDYATLASAWSGFVEDFMVQLEAQGVVVDDFDLLSEPDVFWQGLGSLDELMQLIVAAHDIIRAHRPEAFIVGPSLARYPDGGFDAYFAYLAANEARIDAVSWHELERPELVAGHVAAARASIEAAYAARPDLAPSEVHINEYGAPQSELLPGWAVGWLAALEQAQVDVAARACWNVGPGWTACERGLDGLLMSDQVTPMASFPVYTAYGRLGPARLPVTAPLELSVLAAPGNGGALTLLVGGASCGATGAWCVPADLPAQDDRGPARDLVLRLDGWPAGTVATATALALPGRSQPVALASLEPAPVPAVALVTRWSSRCPRSRTAARSSST